MEKNDLYPWDVGDTWKAWIKPLITLLEAVGNEFEGNQPNVSRATIERYIQYYCEKEFKRPMQRDSLNALLFLLMRLQELARDSVVPPDQRHREGKSDDKK